MDSSGGSQQDSNLYFSAELQDNVSPTADQIEERLKKLGASKHEIKIFLQAYDQATQKIQQAHEQLKKLPKNHIVNIQANADQIDVAHKKLQALRTAAKAPITILIKAEQNLDEHFQKFKQKIPQMEMQLKSSLRNMPLTAGLLGATSQAYNIISGPVSTATGLPFSSLGVGGAALGAGGASVAFFSKSFEQNAALEQQMAQLNQILRSPAQAQQAYNQVVHTSTTTPFNMPDVLRSYIQMAQVGINPQNPAFGIKPAANLAAGSQVPISQATGALQAASLGYFERLNTLTGRNIRQTDFTYGGRYSGQTFQEATIGVLKQYQDASKTQMQTFKGLMTNIQDVITQRVVLPAGQPIFGAVKGIEQQTANKLGSPATQLQMAREVDKVQEGLVKMFQTVQQGTTYFRNSLEQPLKQITSAAVTLGGAFAKTFGGAVVTGVKYLSEALTTILTPLAGIAKQMPIIGQMAGLMKALHVFGISTNTGLGNITKGLGTLNPFRMLEGFKQLSSMIAKIGIYELVKSFEDMKNANDQLDSAFRSFGESGRSTVDTLKVGFDGLIFRANELGKSVAQLKTYGAIAAQGVGPNVGQHKLAQVARFGSLDIAKLSMNLGMGGQDTAQIFKTWEKTMNATGAIQGGTSPRKEMDMIYTQVFQAAEKLSHVLGISLSQAAKDATVSLTLFKSQLAQTHMATPRGASAVYSIYSKLSERGGMTPGDLSKFGSPLDLTRQLLSNAVAPGPDLLKRIMTPAIHPTGPHTFKILPGGAAGLNRAFDFTSNYPNQPLPYSHGGAATQSRTADIESILRGYENIPRSTQRENERIQGQYGWASNLGSGAFGKVQLPQFQNVLPELGLHLKSSQVSGLNTEQTARAIVAVNTAISNQQKVLQNVNQQIVKYQSQLSELGIVGEEAQAAMARFNLSVEAQQKAIDRWQIGLSQAQLNLNGLERQIAAVSQEMTDYEHNRVLPVQRAQEDWNQAMLLTSNRLEDVSFKMQVAQFQMDKYNSGMLLGENALTAQIEKLTVYNQKLDELRLLNMGMQADITKTQFHRGFTSTVQPLMGFDLQREIQLGQERQQLMQDRYDTTYGYKHWQLQRAARPLFQRQEMSFAQRMSGTQQARGTLDKGMLETMTIQIQQYHEQLHSRKLEESMYKLNVGMRGLQDKQYEKQKEAFGLQQNISRQSDKIARAQLKIQEGQLPLQEAINHISNVNTTLSTAIDKKLVPLTVQQGSLITAIADLHNLSGDLSKNFDQTIKGGSDSVLSNLISIAYNMGVSIQVLNSIDKALGGHGGFKGKGPDNFNTSRQHHPGSGSGISGIAQGVWNTVTSPLSLIQNIQDVTHNAARAVGVPGPLATALGFGAAGVGTLEALNLARFGIDQFQGRVVGPALLHRSGTLQARVANREVASIARELGFSRKDIRDLGFKTALPGRGKVGGWFGDQLKRNLAGAPALAPATYLDKKGVTHDASMLRRLTRSPLIHPTNLLRAGGMEAALKWLSLPFTTAVGGPFGAVASGGIGALGGRKAGAVPFEWFKTTRNWWSYFKERGPLGRALSPIGFPLHSLKEIGSTLGHNFTDTLASVSDRASSAHTAAGGFRGLRDMFKEALREEGLGNKLEKLGTLAKPMIATLIDPVKAGVGGFRWNLAKEVADAQAATAPSRGAGEGKGTSVGEDWVARREQRAAARQAAQTADENSKSAKIDARTSETNTRSAKSLSETARRGTANANIERGSVRTLHESAKTSHAASSEGKKTAHENKTTADQLKKTQHEHLNREARIIEREGSHIGRLGSAVGRFGRGILRFSGVVALFSLLPKPFKDAINHLGGIVKGAFTSAIDHLGTYISKFGDFIGNFITKLAHLLHIHLPGAGASHAASDIGKGSRVLSRLGSAASTAARIGGRALRYAGYAGGALSFLPGVEQAFQGKPVAAARSFLNAGSYFVPGLGEMRISADIIKALHLAGILTSGPAGVSSTAMGYRPPSRGAFTGGSGTGVFTPTGGTPTYIKKGAAGGYVTGTTLAIIGEDGPELVIPESKLKSLASRARALPALGHQISRNAPLDDTSFMERIKNNPVIANASQDLTDYLTKRYKQHFKARADERSLHQMFDTSQLKDKQTYYKQDLDNQNQSQINAVTGQYGVRQYLGQLGTFISNHWTKRLQYVDQGYQQEVKAHNAGYQAITSTTSSWLAAIDTQIKKWAKSWKVPISQTANASGSAAQGAMASVQGVGGIGNFQGFEHGGLVHADKHRVGPGRIVRMVEEGHPEVVIPLAPHRRDRARSLLRQTQGMMGMAAGGYVYPFGAGLTQGRTDMGIDMTGAGNIAAIGAGRMTRVVPQGGNTGWPGAGGSGSGAMLVYQLTAGADKGRYVYLAENVDPAAGLRTGSIVKAGQVIAHARGSYPFLESGWAVDAMGTTASAASGTAATHPNHSNTPEGIAFTNFVIGLAHGKLIGGGSFASSGVSAVPPIKLKDVPKILKQMGIVGGMQSNILEHVRKKAQDHFNQQAASVASSVGGLGPSMSLSGPVSKEVYQYMSKQGFNKVAIAGMLGNAVQESGLNPNTPGGGLWQQISNFGSGTGGSLLHQMQVMLPQILGLKNILNSAPSPEMAALAFSNLFEKDAGTAPNAGPYTPNTAASANIPRREAGARAAFAAGYSGGHPRIPHDNFKAVLHKDERILSASEAEFQRKSTPYTGWTVLKDAINEVKKELHQARIDIKDHTSFKKTHEAMIDIRDSLRDLKKDTHHMLLNQIAAEIKATGPQARRLDHLLGKEVAKSSGGYGPAGTQASRLLESLIGTLHNLPGKRGSHHSLEDEQVKLTQEKLHLKSDLAVLHKKHLSSHAKKLDERLVHRDHHHINALQKAIASDESGFMKRGMTQGISRQMLTAAIRDVGMFDNQGIVSDAQIAAIPSALLGKATGSRIGLANPVEAAKMLHHHHKHHKHHHKSYALGGPVLHEEVARVHRGEHVVPQHGALVLREAQRAAHEDIYTKRTAEGVTKTNDLLRQGNKIWDKLVTMYENAAIKGAVTTHRLGTLTGARDRIAMSFTTRSAALGASAGKTAATVPKPFIPLVKEIRKLEKEYQKERRILEAWHKKVEREWKTRKANLEKLFKEQLKTLNSWHKKVEQEYKSRKAYIEKLFKRRETQAERHHKEMEARYKEMLKKWEAHHKTVDTKLEKWHKEQEKRWNSRQSALAEWHKEHMKTLNTWHTKAEKEFDMRRKELMTWHKDQEKKIDKWHSRKEKEYEKKRQELNTWHKKIENLKAKEEKTAENYRAAVYSHHNKQAAHYLKVEQHLKRMADKIERLNPNIQNNLTINVSGTTAQVRTNTSPAYSR